MKKTKEEYEAAIRESHSIASVCRKLGIRPTGGNYRIVHKAIKRRLLKEGFKERHCECCGLYEWRGKEIPLELHHINGDNCDNRIENLQILCPNCHALTDNYRGLNKSAHQETGDVELP